MALPNLEARRQETLAERLIDIVIPSARMPELTSILEASGLERNWSFVIDPQASVRVLAPIEHVEDLIDETERVFLGAEPFWIVVTSAEACVPKAAEAEESVSGIVRPEARASSRLSRQELYDDLAEAGRIDRIFLITVVLSTIVAAIGLLKDSGAIIIGAMVIAPLLGPNMLLAFATTLGDSKMGWRALRANGVGFLVAVAVAVPIAWISPLDMQGDEVLARAQVDGGDFVLALASGVAGALAYTTGLASSLVGVMVAVAILPPAVCSAMLLANGCFDDSLAAALLLAVNVVCVNLGSVLTFFWRGVRPRSWWAADRSRRSTRLALCLWIFLAAILAVLVIVTIS